MLGITVHLRMYTQWCTVHNIVLVIIHIKFIKKKRGYTLLATVLRWQVTRYTALSAEMFCISLFGVVSPSPLPTLHPLIQSTVQSTSIQLCTYISSRGARGSTTSTLLRSYLCKIYRIDWLTWNLKETPRFLLLYYMQYMVEQVHN